MDEGFDGGLAFGDGATAHDLGQVFADPGDGARWWQRGPVVEFIGELRVPRSELGEPVAEFADAGSGGGVVHGAVFERRVIPVDCGLAGGDLGGECGEFRVAVPGRGLVVLLGPVDHIYEDRFGVGVEVVEGLEDEVVDFVSA